MTNTPTNTIIAGMPMLTTSHEDAMVSSASERTRACTDDADSDDSRQGCETRRLFTQKGSIEHYECADYAHCHAYRLYHVLGVHRDSSLFLDCIQ